MAFFYYLTQFTSVQRLAVMLCTSFILSACGAEAPYIPVINRTDAAADTNYPTPAGVADFETEEYNKSNALGGDNGVKAAYAYSNIKALIDAGTSDVTQGGAGQIISVTSDTGFNSTHQEFNDGSTDGAIFDSIYDASSALSALTDINGDATVNDADRLYSTNADIIDSSIGNCTGSDCNGTQYVALITGRKNNAEMHSIAYNAKIKGIITDNSEALLKAIPQGVGANIIAMNNVFDDNIVTEPSADGNPSNFYYRPAGIGYRPSGEGLTDDEFKALNKRFSDGELTDAERDALNKKLSDAELNAWIEAVAPAGDNKTIMVFGTNSTSGGNGNGFNSETGQVKLEGGGANGNVPAITAIGGINPMAANIPSFRAGYPALYNDDDLQAGEEDKPGRWLAVTALDENGAILESANGCGITMRFCLAAPGKDIYTADGSGNDKYITESGTQYASSTVAGALAVLKGAFPNMTPEQLTLLVLETATYIPLDNRNVDGSRFELNVRGYNFTEDALYHVKIKNADGTKRYINPVYGYGLLNLQAATTPSVTSSYVTASNNESVGVLWQDTSLTLSSHFGGNFESVKFGIGDAYGRHFVTQAPQTSYAPVAVGLDDYMTNLNFGLLGENIKSQKLGGQSQLNYSNIGTGDNPQNWMNLEYKSGNTTSKIAFQDSYKISPLSDTGATTILRANNIRPASNNIGMMDVDYQLGNALLLSSYIARGEYDTGYKFDELGTDFDLNYKKSTLNIGLGNLREHEQFLGTNTSGAYELSAPSVSRFTDVTYGHDVGKKFNIYANYINYQTDVAMGYQQFATIDNLQADQYQVGIKGRSLISKDDNLNIALITKLGVTDGALNQNTVIGYTDAGAYNNVSQSYDLAVADRHQQFEITYQGRLYQNADKVSKLRDNRFFTSLRVDQNLNHEQGASQTEIVSGVSARF